MSGPLRNHTALIVEEDVGFLLWLGQLLADAGYRTIPASDCRQAATFARTIGVPLQLVVVNTGLPGINRMLRALGAEHRDLRIIAIVSPGKKAPAKLPAAAILERPKSSEHVSREFWLHRIHHAVADAPPLASAARASGSP